MEDQSEVHSEENKVSLEKNKKRRFKTPAQVLALEKFYDEHNYPTEEMKLQLAEQLGLTEKQISGWFCHRRLKDKRLLADGANANERKDRSSIVLQDRGSGLRQDSCGSTKQGDYRNIDPKEVESRRLYNHEFSAPDLCRSENTGNVDSMDNTIDTSTKSSLSLHDRHVSQIQDPYDVGTSRSPTQHGAVMLVNLKDTVNVRYKPSGFLKVKGEIENAAITAVKRQLGRHYREDGPPLGVEFQPLPPGAFESSSCNPVNEPIFVGNPRPSHSPAVYGRGEQPAVGNRYEVHSFRRSSQDSYVEGANCDTVNDFDHHDAITNGQLKQKSTHLNYPKCMPVLNTSLDIYEDSAKETLINNSWKYRMSTKHCVERMRSESVLNHSGPCGKKVSSERNKGLFHEHDVSPNIVQMGENAIRPSKGPGCSKSIDAEERGISTKMAKVEKLYGERKATEDHHDPIILKKMHSTYEMNVAKRGRLEFPHQGYVTKASDTEMPSWNNPINMSAGQMPSSSSEDDTAETTSSSE